MKVDFIDSEHFTVYYICSSKLRTEEDLKCFLKMFNNYLKQKYNYVFKGYYNVNIYNNSDMYVLVFNNIDDYGIADFNINMSLSAPILYEFTDSDIIDGRKIYYDGKFYVEIDRFISDIHLFEYGNVIVGDYVNKIINNGIIIDN